MVGYLNLNFMLNSFQVTAILPLTVHLCLDLKGSTCNRLVMWALKYSWPTSHLVDGRSYKKIDKSNKMNDNFNHGSMQIFWLWLHPSTTSNTKVSNNKNSYVD